MDHEFYDLLMQFQENPWMLALLLLALTFILEDSATTSGALLASQGYISIELALVTVVIGIILGDLGLYGLGYAAQRWEWAKKILEKKGANNTHDFIEHRMVMLIIIARFIPGMRLPSYSAMGFLGVSFKKFAFTVFFAVGTWTAILFTAFYHLGNVVMDMVGMWRWTGIFAIIVVGILAPMLIGFVTKRLRGMNIPTEQQKRDAHD